MDLLLPNIQVSHIGVGFEIQQKFQWNAMTQLPTCTDKELLRQCTAGNQQAWEELVNRFSDVVFRTIQFSLHRYNVPYSRRDLEDFHNTVFLKLFEHRCKKLRQYKGTNGCSVRSWIRLIAIRVVIDRLRADGRDADARLPGKRNLEELPELAGHFQDPLSRLEAAEKSRLLQKALGMLQPRDRLFLKLHFLEELSIGRVAKMLNITENNAYSVKHRALNRLKAGLERISASQN
ncbi:MAG TPA: RNA polymerase sigma factor [Desulfobacterales bacterium]